MRVKRLEIQGFKSFKDRTVVHFDHSITGIVGPNGCGKSNIVDAFFWVMGEQSYKHMRGSSSDDLIFNGSSKYSPLGMAEATLVLETDVVDTLSDAPSGATTQDVPIHLKTKEVSVTRRLYRSGEGEYLINGTTARLKDIQELFMDTGVGAKGYSVIEQGQIGKIVNSKPEERRLLIEEAAGIAKYKARKKESLRKMEATQANLARLTDIIQEIEKTLASLERQAQKARQYKKYKDELIDKEMTWGRRKNAILQERLNVLKAQRDTLEQDLLGMRAQLQTAENSTEVSRIQLLTETKEAESLQARIQDLASDLSHEKSALELSRRRQGDLTSQLEALEEEKEDLQASIETDTEKLAEQETQAQEVEQLFQAAAHESREASQALQGLRREVDEARSQLDRSQRQLMSGIQQTSELNSKSASLLGKIDSARSQSERLQSQLTEQEEKHQEIQEELEKAKGAYSELQEKRQFLQARKQEQAAQVQEQDQEIRQLEKAKEQALRSLTQIKSKLQSLEELDESHEGLADGPKAALDWAKSNGQVDQILAITDVLQVAPGYETILESWLENQLESLVTKDSTLVLPLLEQIQKNQQGRVTFQLAHSIQGQPKTGSKKQPSGAESLKELGFVSHGKLSDYVKWESAYSSRFDSLFENVFSVESLAPLPAVLESENTLLLEGMTLIAKDGTVFDSRGTLRGGSLKSSGAVGILRRKRTIEELKEQVQGAEVQSQTAEEAVLSAKENIEIIRAQLQSIQTEAQELEVQAAATQRDVHQTERALTESQKLLQNIKRDTSSMHLDSERAEEEREKLESQLETLLSARVELEDTIASLESNLSSKESVYQEKDQELQAVRLREASLRERSVSLKRELEATRSIKSDRERRFSEVNRTLDRATREQEEFSGGEEDLTQKIEELTFALAAARETLSQVKDRMEQANAQLNATLEQIKVLHKSSDQKSSEANHLAVEIEKISSELSHLVANLEEKYGPGCLILPILTEAANTEGSEDSPGNPQSLAELTPEEEIALGEEVERLRERIRRLGEVNVMAIEEFEHLKKRFDHLLTEKTDLEHSLENLQNAIEHINQTSEQRFKKAFEAIASRFERLFPIIFGGGQAKLSLVYPEGSQEILDAGVDILAQPPGKKVANITLLSGGEKALTAVSLIFAIFMVKPSPFCVLDEVDAPLDDANIGKFNALLREMSVKSQFILITHNKKTMELNDTLYGVTMEEPGVSKMVSIEMH